MFRDLFKAAAAVCPPAGLAPFNQVEYIVRMLYMMKQSCCVIINIKFLCPHEEMDLGKYCQNKLLVTDQSMTVNFKKKKKRLAMSVMLL